MPECGLSMNQENRSVFDYAPTLQHNKENKCLVQLLHDAMDECNRKIEIKMGDKIFKGDSLSYNWEGEGVITISFNVDKIKEIR